MDFNYQFIWWSCWEHIHFPKLNIHKLVNFPGQQLDVYILCLQKSKDDACICSTSPGIIWRTPTTTVPQIRQFMAFVVITIKLHDLFCLDNFDIGMLFPEK